MKKVLKLILFIASLNIGAQTSIQHSTGAKFPNATEVTTATKIPVLDANLKMNTWISAENLLDGLASGSVGASGLEAIDEGNGTGWRLIGFDPLNYGNIGLNAINLGLSTSVSSTKGATGSYSFNTGRNGEASGNSSFNTGRDGVASGYYSYNTGYNGTASGFYSFNTGVFGTVSGTYSFNTGYNGTASEEHSFNTGYNGTASGSYSFNTGVLGTASEEHSFNSGHDGTASGNYSFNTGRNGEASGYYSFNTGYNGKALGIASFNSGQNGAVSGDYSFNSGYNGRASGNYSFNSAFLGLAPSRSETNMGAFSTIYTPVGEETLLIAEDRLFNIGNGTDVLRRSDAFTILKNGKTGIGYDNFETTTSDALLQVDGSIESTDSIILKDTQNTNRYKITIVNGVLTTTLIP